MQRTIIILLVFCSLLFAGHDKDEDKMKQKRVDKQIKEEMEKEKKYAKEQTFYSGENYDLERAKVNEESLSSIPEIEDDYEFDMDSVYD
jgi:uncharacterized protein YdaU (DUF1376 family)